MNHSGVRRARFALDGDVASITAARDHVHAFFGAASPPLNAKLLEDALLAVSELVSNAVRHAPGPCVLLLGDDGRQATIAVTDMHNSLPVLRPGDLGGDGGFGLQLLRAVAGSVTTQQHAGGKTISVSLERSR